MRTVLVTGHAGFIGYHLSASLLRNGDRVIGIDSMSDYYDPDLKKARLAELFKWDSFEHNEFSIVDERSLRAVIESTRPDIVVHLAAQAGVRYSLEAPEAYISSNIIGTFNLLNVLKDCRPSHLLLASTSSVYGGNREMPFSELHRTDFPVSLYAATKKATEDLSHSYAHLWDLPTTCFRFFTVYGPWGRPDMALFKFVKALRAGEPVDVYGGGKMKRDFTYVGDLVQCINRLTDFPPLTGVQVGEHDSVSPVAPFRAVNIAGGAPVGLLDFIAAIEGATGVEAIRNMLPMQPGDVVDTNADVSLLRALIGEVPSTPVTKGVKEFVNWYDAFYSHAPNPGEAERANS